MEERNQDVQGKIELRSEKVREFIGEIPPSLVRWGTIIIVFIFIALACAVAFIPYPYGQQGETILQHIIHSLYGLQK